MTGRSVDGSLAQIYDPNLQHDKCLLDRNHKPELSSATENIGIGFELQVVTIVLLGGVSIFGGRGTCSG